MARYEKAPTCDCCLILRGDCLGGEHELLIPVIAKTLKLGFEDKIYIGSVPGGVPGQ